MYWSVIQVQYDVVGKSRRLPFTSSRLALQIASLALKKDHKFITTLTEEDVNVHDHVRQESLVVPSSDVLSASLDVLLNEEAKGQDGSAGFKGKQSPSLALDHFSPRGSARFSYIQAPFKDCRCRKLTPNSHGILANCKSRWTLS